MFFVRQLLRIMAKENITRAAENILSNMQKGNYAPVYLLMGDEGYYTDVITNYVLKNALKEEEKYFNLTLLFGSDTNMAQVIDLCRQYPTMAPRRVVVIKEAQNLKQWELLEHYLDKPAKTTILVLAYKNGKVDRRKKVVTKIEKMGVVFESRKLYDSELPQFISNYAHQHHLEIEPKSIQMIANHIGADLNRITTEMDKLMVGMNGGNTITPQIVEDTIGISKDFNIFELKSALVNKDVYKTNLIIDYFNKNPKAGSIYMLLPFLYRFFANLMVIWYAPNKNPRQLAAYMGMKSEWALKDYLTGMRNYSPMKVMQILDKIEEMDAKGKGINNPSTPPEELLQELIFFILH